MEKKHYRIGIKWKMFATLICFVMIFAICLWVFQISMFTVFYQGAKFNEFDTVAKNLKDNTHNDGDLKNMTDYYSELCNSDIWVYKVVNGSFEEKLPWTYEYGVRDDLGGYFEVKFRDLYKVCKDNGGKYVMAFAMEKFKESYYNLDILKDNKDAPERAPIVVSNLNEVGAMQLSVFQMDGYELLVVQRTSITPMGTMVNTLKNQVLLVGVILVVLALALAAIMSKIITKPIIVVNNAAKNLAVGKYNVEFSGKGYREIDELSDTLNLAAKELSRNDKLQKELISNVSHDLRTPLTMIKGYSEIMRDIPGENTPENVQIIIDEATRLTELVNDMLDLSKIQAKGENVEMSEFCLTETIRSTLYRYEKLIEQGGYNIDFFADRDVYVYANKGMILQVIYNLINNAVNYTGDDKYVCVRQFVKGDSVCITVADTGAGISEENIRNIWDRYYKVDKVHKRATVGTGLGLSIVKGILELHNATYGVSSTPNKGSTFWFELKTTESDEYKAELVDI